MPTQMLDQDSGIDPQDPTRLLEMKIHYLMSCMAKAGLLLDADGNPANSSDIVEADADEVKSYLTGPDYWKP